MQQSLCTNVLDILECILKESIDSLTFQHDAHKVQVQAHAQ